jgi:electron transport complex protein RnfG
MTSKKEFIMPTLVLTIICLVAAAALAFTNQVTEPLIAQAQAEAANAARVLVLPQADSFTQITDYKTENVYEVYKADNGSGYAITTIAKGYGGNLQVMVGISSEGTISGTQVMICNETPGLGDRVQKDPYRSQYVGKDASLEGVDIISGSTVSSRAFESAVKTAFMAYSEVSGNPSGLEGKVDPRKTLFPGVELTPIDLPSAKEAYRAGNEGYLIVTTAIGYYETEMEVITAIGADGKIVGVGLGANQETEGVGTQVGEYDYTTQYIGKDINDIEGVDVVTGATVSSQSFELGVKKALRIVTPEMLAELQEVSEK